MKKHILISILISGLLAFIPNAIMAQTRKSLPQQKDTVKMKDPINRMPDSTQLRQMMRDSNVMKNPDQMQKDSMPMKKGWINSDSINKKKSTKI